MSTVSDDKWEGAAWYWTISRLHYVAVCNEYILGIRVCIFASHPCACRLCIYGCKWGARGTCYVCCRSCLMFVVSMLRWPHRAIVPDLHLYRHRTLSSVINYLSRAIWICQTVWCTYGLYLCYITTFHITFLSVTHHVHTRTNICTLWQFQM